MTTCLFLSSRVKGNAHPDLTALVGGAEIRPIKTCHAQSEHCKCVHEAPPICLKAWPKSLVSASDKGHSH